VVCRQARGAPAAAAQPQLQQRWSTARPLATPRPLLQRFWALLLLQPLARRAASVPWAALVPVPPPLPLPQALVQAAAARPLRARPCQRAGTRRRSGTCQVSPLLAISPPHCNFPFSLLTVCGRMGGVGRPSSPPLTFPIGAPPTAHSHLTISPSLYSQQPCVQTTKGGTWRLGTGCSRSLLAAGLSATALYGCACDEAEACILLADEAFQAGLWTRYQSSVRCWPRTY
jgi:hypothetical protein